MVRLIVPLLSDSYRNLMRSFRRCASPFFTYPCPVEAPISSICRAFARTATFVVAPAKWRLSILLTWFSAFLPCSATFLAVSVHRLCSHSAFAYKDCPHRRTDNPARPGHAGRHILTEGPRTRPAVPTVRTHTPFLFVFFKLQ